MVNRVIVKNSAVAGKRPATNTGAPGELFVNVADKVIGTFDTSGNPIELGLASSLKGSIDPTTTAPPSGITSGQYYFASNATAGTVIASWTGAAGKTINAGDMIIWDGAKWEIVQASTSAAGANQQVQYNDGSVRAGAANMLWNKTTNILSLGGTGALKIPVGNATTERPATPVVGMIRYNNVSNSFEGYSGATPAWSGIGGATLTATQVGFGSATNGLTGSADITWNDTAATGKTLTIGGTSTGVALVTNRDVTINTLTIGLGNGNVSTNTAVGFEALKATTKGSSVALGFRALAATQTGQSNTALGAYAMLQANGASNNVAVGTFAMYNKTFVGDGCVAMGYFALKDATTTTNTVCIGSNALPVLTGGNGIVAIGGEAGSALTGGNYHTFIGFGAATRCTGGVGNVAIGYNCLNGANTTTTVAIGTNAFTNLNDTVSHSASIAIGNNAGSLVASAVNSTLIGNNQLTTGATISNIVVISAGVTEKFGANSAGAFTVASAGSAALPAIINSKWDGTGTGGTGTGIWWPAANTIATSAGGFEGHRVVYNAGWKFKVRNEFAGDLYIKDILATIGGGNTPGSGNLGFGANPFNSSLTGAQNIAIGANILNAGTTASNCYGIGDYAFNALKTGSNNLAIGPSAMRRGVDATSCTAIGYNALQNLFTSLNSITAIGANAGNYLLTGVNSIFIGGGTNITGATNSLVIGDGSFPANTAFDAEVLISAGSNLRIGVRKSGQKYTTYAGTAAAPSLVNDTYTGTGTGGAGTGLFWPAAGEMAISAAGVESTRWSARGFKVPSFATMPTVTAADNGTLAYDTTTNNLKVVKSGAWVVVI